MSASRALAVLATAAPLFAAGAGCAPRGRAPAPSIPTGAAPADLSPRASRDELLLATGDSVWRGDLVGAHRALARLADRQRGKPDPALDFWSELLALLRCEPLPRAPRPSAAGRPLEDRWDRLRRLVQLERVRLGRDEGGERPKAATISNPKHDLAHDPKQVLWPVEAERWNDELPVPAVISRCPVGGSPPALAADEASAGEVALVSEAARSFPGDDPATPILLVQAAVLEIARGRPAAAAAPLARLEQVPGSTLTEAEKNGALVAAAIAAVADPAAPPELVLARGRAALAVELAPEARRAIQLRLAERLFAGGRVEEASAVLGPPPHGDDRVGRYLAFRQAEAHARAGRRAPLLAEARETLGRLDAATIQSEPALVALRDLAYQTLLASPVSAETMEVLESLGPPRERLARAEAFAQLALEAGAHHAAMATFTWLYGNDGDPRQQLQHLARASVAAARAGDRAEFARTFRTLAGQEQTDPKSAAKVEAKADGKDTKDGKKGDASGTRSKAEKAEKAEKAAGMISSAEADRGREKQRASRSANWQRALLVVARDALSALVENDDQANLATLVDTLKRHLGAGGRGPVDEELTTLYRAASAHLRTGARAYAETVGAERRPILLGDVRIGRTHEVRRPKVDPAAALQEVGPFVFVPRRGNDPAPASLVRWPSPFGTPWTGARS